MENDKVLKEGLIDCISYDPPNTERVFNIIQKLDHNSTQNLGNQDHFELLLVFQNDENSAILNDVLKANTETDQYKREFSEATYNPEKLEELRKRFNV